MTHEDTVYDRRVRLIEHAAKIDNIAEACRAFGVSRKTYYDWTSKAEKYGLSALLPKERAVAEYFDWYNHRRLHGEIGLVPSAEYETNHWASQPVQHYRENPVLTEVGSNQPSLHEARGDSSRDADQSPQPVSRKP